VHFIKLRLFDNTGKEVGSNFYWRSTSVYEGMKSMTGPATAGFQSIKDLAPAKVSVKYKNRISEGRHYIDIELRNTNRAIAFFTQLQWLDSAGKPVRPSYYTDNFFSMMPGESRSITIETDKKDLPADNYSLILKGFNITQVKNTIIVQ
jgi:mannosylglycoprotein endo-beta-mannosidase